MHRLFFCTSSDHNERLFVKLNQSVSRADNRWISIVPRQRKSDTRGTGVKRRVLETKAFEGQFQSSEELTAAGLPPMLVMVKADTDR